MFGWNGGLLQQFPSWCHARCFFLLIYTHTHGSRAYKWVGSNPIYCHTNNYGKVLSYLVKLVVKILISIGKDSDVLIPKTLSMEGFHAFECLLLIHFSFSLYSLYSLHACVIMMQTHLTISLGYPYLCTPRLLAQYTAISH